jgi:CO dehydrogenase maturation factor
MKTIMTAGKGGTGKSVTLAHLINRHILPSTQGVLVVDADPHMSLTQLLSPMYHFDIPVSLGELRHTHKAALRSGQGLEQASREELAELLVQKSLVALPGGSALLVMGENDQPGCQCVVNSLLGRALDALREKFGLAVVDNEAGVEHIGRHHGWAVDTLLLFATMRPLDLDVAARILQKADAVQREIRQTVFVVNHYRSGLRLGNTESLLPDVWLTLPYSQSLGDTNEPDENWLSSLKILWGGVDEPLHCQTSRVRAVK